MYEEIIKKIEDARHIVIISHVNPDADSLGCSLAMYKYLKNSKKRVSLFNATKELPYNLSHLPNIGKVTSKFPAKVDLIISCDCADYKRYGVDTGALFKINFDHHKSNDAFAELSVIDANKASTAEVLYDFFHTMQINIDKEMAACLYTALIDDSKAFSTKRSNAKTLEVAHALSLCGIDIVCLQEKLYMRNSLAKLRLSARGLAKLELVHDASIAYIYLSQEDFSASGAKAFDSEYVLNQAFSLATVEIAILVREEPNFSLKTSLRSKNEIDVSFIATSFGGGGHKNAAGFSVYDKDEKKLKTEILERFSV